MKLTKKEQKDLINSLSYGMSDLVILMDQTKNNDATLSAAAGIIDIFQFLVKKFNNAEIEKEQLF